MWSYSNPKKEKESIEDELRSIFGYTECCFWSIETEKTPQKGVFFLCLIFKNDKKVKKGS